LAFYDLTNTYFEGSAEQIPEAQFGRSKEKRSDSRLKVRPIDVYSAEHVKAQVFLCMLAFYVE